jgi:protein-disulfide isomerase
MSKGTGILGMMIALVVGYFLGGYMQGGGGGAPMAQIPAAAVPDSNVERYKVAIGNEPSRGGDKPKVTIVEWSDFQCPFCSRVEPTIDQILKTYGKDVKVVWKNNPLPFHQNAMPAAQLAMYAHEKGKFWEAHHKLFQNQQQLDRASLEKYAGELGLDVEGFKKALEENKYVDQIKKEQRDAALVGARGTPAFFINGRFLNGAQPFEAFQQILDEELQAKVAARP